MAVIIGIIVFIYLVWKIIASSLDKRLKNISSQIALGIQARKEVQIKTEEVKEKTAELDKKNAELDKKIAWNKKLGEGVIQMAKERQIGFPWLANAYDELFRIEENYLVDYLKSKKHPVLSTAERVKELSQLRRQAEKEKKIAQYIIEYYEYIAPFLIDLKEELDIATEQERELLKEYSDDESLDETTQYLTKEEYRNLPSIERNQIALDRFWKRPKSKWLIGRMYERYVGYLFEEQGYDVEYVGIFKGYEDLGRDLICQKENDFIIIQCKNWAQFRTIYEKHIFQFFGTVFQYKDENPDRTVKAIFYTSTELSKLARRFANELGIELKENFKFEKQGV
jgi:DUF2075 family protein